MYQLGIRHSSRSLENYVRMTVTACGMVLGRFDVIVATFGVYHSRLKRYNYLLNFSVYCPRFKSMFYIMILCSIALSKRIC